MDAATDITAMPCGWWSTNTDGVYDCAPSTDITFTASFVNFVALHVMIRSIIGAIRAHRGSYVGWDGTDAWVNAMFVMDEPPRGSAGTNLVSWIVYCVKIQEYLHMFVVQYWVCVIFAVHAQQIESVGLLYMLRVHGMLSIAIPAVKITTVLAPLCYLSTLM